MDFGDHAQALAQTLHDTALEAHLRRPRPVSAASPQCVSCGDDIPPLRLAAITGCCLCIECQTELERRMR